MQESYLGHDVVLEGECCIVNVTVSEPQIELVQQGGRGSLMSVDECLPEGSANFPKAVLVARRVQSHMSVLFASQNSVPDDDLVLDLFSQQTVRISI